MAILTNVILRGAKKRLAGTVLYQQGGRTLMRELAPQVSNPRTSIQMTQRVKWANLVSFYRANKSWIKKAYEDKKQTQSDYNVFMSKNVASSLIYLTKQQAASGSCVVGPYKVSDGSLQQVESYANGSDWVTNLFTGTLANISNETKVGDFSEALLSANAGLRQFDQLSIVRCTQLVNNSTGFPYVQVRTYEVILDERSNRLLSDFMPLDILLVSQLQEKNALGIKNNGNQGGWAMIVSRTEAGKLLVSPSTITLVNMTDFLKTYISPAARLAAIDSYGTSGEVFLSNDNANGVTRTPVTLSLTGLTINGTEQELGSAQINSGQTISSLKVKFNSDIEGKPELIKIVKADGSVTYGSSTNIRVNSLDPTTIELTSPMTTTSVSNTTGAKLIVVVSGANYETPIRIYFEQLGD